MSALARAVAVAERWLSGINHLELDLGASRFLVAPEDARRLLPAASPRSGLVVEEADGELAVGLYVDPRDHDDVGTIVEETSHLLCLAWHANQGRPVSRLILELQGEVDRYAFSRLAGDDGLDHFQGFRWDGWMDDATRSLYRTAHSVGHRYCRSLSRRYPQRADTPALLAELRRFYRAPAEQKLAAG